MEQEIVQLVIFHTEDNRPNSPKDQAIILVITICFPWVIWKCLIKQNYFFISNSLHNTDLWDGVAAGEVQGAALSDVRAEQAFLRGETSQLPPYSLLG